MEAGTNKGEWYESVAIWAGGSCTFICNELHRSYVKKTAHFIYSFLLSMCYFAAIDAESDFNMLVGRSPEDITYVEQNTVAIPLLPLHL